MNSLGGNIIINVNAISAFIGMMFGEKPIIYITFMISRCVLNSIWSYYFIPKNQLWSALIWNFIYIVIALLSISDQLFCKFWSKIKEREKVEDNDDVITVEEIKIENGIIEDKGEK